MIGTEISLWVTLTWVLFSNKFRLYESKASIQNDLDSYALLRPISSQRSLRLLLWRSLYKIYMALLHTHLFKSTEAVNAIIFIFSILNFRLDRHKSCFSKWGNNSQCPVNIPPPVYLFFYFFPKWSNFNTKV